MRTSGAIKRMLLAAGLVCAAQTGKAFADTATFTASATTQAALSVTCGANLRFGTIGVEPSNAAATITVAASSGSTATSSNTAAVYPAGSNSGPGECTVTNETGSNATASLSASSGTFSGTTLSGVSLSDGGVNTLSADVNLNKATGVTNETLYIGGTLSIPASHTAFGAYTQTITLTVTD